MTAHMSSRQCLEELPAFGAQACLRIRIRGRPQVPGNDFQAYTRSNYLVMQGPGDLDQQASEINQINALQADLALPVCSFAEHFPICNFTFLEDFMLQGLTGWTLLHRPVEFRFICGTHSNDYGLDLRRLRGRSAIDMV